MNKAQFSAINFVRGSVMKKIILFFLLTIFITNSSVQALSWAYIFVVWDGKVYEVTDEQLAKNEIGKNIGKVKRKADDMTGEYYGDASNYYPKGTKYYAVNDQSTSRVIAVEVEENKWVKAIYAHKAPLHWMDFFTKILPVLLLVAAVVAIFLRRKKYNQN